MNLQDAITEWEGANNAYTSATTIVTNDQAAVAAIQVKLDAANSQTVTDQSTQTGLVAPVNAALDDIIAAAQAAKIPTA